MPNIPGIDPSREFLRGGKDRWNGFFVILKVSKVLFKEITRDLEILKTTLSIHFLNEDPHG